MLLRSKIQQQLKLLKRGEPLDSIIHSHKLEVLMQILAFAREAKDKVLVFTHSRDTLDYIERQLKIKHSRYLRLDGKTPVKDRQEMASEFNNGKPEVFLISTGAGSTGLNMFGANRVVIVDDHFNPMHEEQAIGRSYRIGQKKHVYVYRLTVAGTFEVALQNQSLFKTQLATRVVDKKNPVRFALKGSRQYLFAPKEIEQEDLSGFAGRDVYVLDRILASQAE